MERLTRIMIRVEESAKNKKGVSFYLVKEKTYCFIETTEPQRFRIKCAIHPRVPKVDMSIMDDHLVDVLDMNY